MPSTIQGRIVFLDYMRIFAFVSVLVGHKLIDQLDIAISDTQNHITIIYFLKILHALCYGGAAGVVVFFLTSGYIITHVLQTEKPTEFLIKRAFRIYPLYIVAVISEVLLGHIVNGAHIPSASTMIPRILLIGDFFQTPTALANVEWTLRIEILFYLFMAIIKKIGIIEKPQIIPLIYAIVGTTLFIMPNLPAKPIWSFAYVNTYTLFLLVGSLLYLGQQRLIGIATCLTVCTGLIAMFLIKIAETHPFWKDSNYAIFAIGIFVTALVYGKHFKYSKFVGLLSNLTFSVYLFHNWLWDYIALPVSALGVTGTTRTVLILILLLSICYCLHITIERRGISLGKKLLQPSSEKAIVPASTI